MNARLVVLISGNGSNLQALLDVCACGDIPAGIVAVVSNKADAYGLARACQAGIPAVVLEKVPGQERGDYDAKLAELVAAHRPDWIVLAGWMRLLTSAFLDRFPGRVVNLHPALPGTFPGTHAIERSYAAWKAGEIDRTGVMVHLVPDEGVDSGPVLGVQELTFLPAETLEEFEQRVHLAEHDLLVRTIRALVS
jgi:phosphoribosylglycinamide formyltransferase-1